MTITKYTFFSPNGNDYPVTANADAKLYMMLGNLPYSTFDRKDWETPTEAGLTKTYVNTSFIIAGRYFELHDHLITLNASTKNYIHIAIDLSTPLDPVSITVASADQSNEIDINNGSGVYKRCFEVVTTNGGSILSTQYLKPTRIIEDINVGSATIATEDVTTLKVLNSFTSNNGGDFKGKLWADNAQVRESFISKSIAATNTITAGGKVKGGELEATGKTTTKTIEIKGDPALRSDAFKSPTIYSTINGTALQEFLLYKNGNTVTGNFADIRIVGGIPGGGAIIGWIQDHRFKPEFTHKFSWRTLHGKNFMVSVDPGGAFRSWGDALAIGDEIYGGVFWTCEGTEGGIK